MSYLESFLFEEIIAQRAKKKTDAELLDN